MNLVRYYVIISALTILSSIGSIAFAGSLHDAARNGDMSGVQQLLSQGVSVDEVDKRGRTPLYWASQEGHLAIVELLASKGANVNAVSAQADNFTPVIVASYRGYPKIVEYLVDQGADIEAVDSKGLTSLYWAYKQEHFEIVRYLIKKGAKDREIPGFSFLTILYTGFREADVQLIELLISRGADVNQRENFEASLAAVMAKKKRIKLKKSEQNGETLIYQAVAAGDVEAAKLLVKYGADLEVKATGIIGSYPNYYLFKNQTPFEVAELWEEKYPGLRTEILEYLMQLE